MNKRLNFISLWKILFGFLLCFNSSLWAQENKEATEFVTAPEDGDRTVLLEQINSEYTKSVESIDTESLNDKQISVLKKEYKARLKAAETLVNSKNTIISGSLFDYINEIYTTIISSNTEINPSSKLVLFRDRAFNAFTLGDNIIFVNIGLLYRFTNRDQVAMVLAHELAHNTKKHTYLKILADVKLKTDYELNTQMKKIVSMEYGQVSALNELLIPSILALKEMSRKFEFEADSLGLVYYINAGFSEQHLDDIFKIMEDADKVYNPQLIDYDLLFHLNGQPAILSRYSDYSKTSSLGEFIEDENELEPYLRSHPYEIDRILAIKSYIQPIKKDPTIKSDTSYLQIKCFIEGEMVYSAIGDNDFSDVFYYSIRMHQNYPTDNYSSSTLSYMFSFLSFYKTRRMSGKYIDNQNIKNDEVLDRSNFFLSILNPTECLELSKEIRNKWIATGYKSIIVDLIDLTYDFHSKNINSLSLRIDKVEPIILSTLLENSIKAIKEDPLVKGKL